MGISDILALVFGILASVLGILLKAESDKRMSLQQQVAEDKREAYGKFSEAVNALVSAIKSGAVALFYQGQKRKNEIHQASP